MNTRVEVKGIAPAWRFARGAMAWGGLFGRWWWAMILLAVGAIALNTAVETWADCRYLYQVQLEQYQIRPEVYGAPPELIYPPLITPLIRVVGRVVNAASAWIGWAVGLTLVGLLLSAEDARLATALKIAVWSWLPYVVCSLAQCVYMWLTQDPIYNPGLSGLVLDQTPPPLGGGYTYVMPAKGQLVWAEVLSRVDLYLFGHLALIVHGLRRRVRLSVRTALPVTLGVGGALLALALLPTVLGPAFARFRFF